MIIFQPALTAALRVSFLNNNNRGRAGWIPLWPMLHGKCWCLWDPAPRQRKQGTTAPSVHSRSIFATRCPADAIDFFRSPSTGLAPVFPASGLSIPLRKNRRTFVQHGSVFFYWNFFQVWSLVFEVFSLQFIKTAGDVLVPGITIIFNPAAIGIPEKLSPVLR